MERFWNSTKAFCRENKTSIVSYIFLVGVYFIAIETFNSILDVEGFNYFNAQLRRFADAMLLALPIFFMRKRILVCLYSLLPTAYILANAWYYRTYFTLMPLSSFKMIDNLEGLSDSIIGSMRYVDILIVAPTLLFIVYYIVYGKHITSRKLFTRTTLAVVPVLLCGIFILPSYIIHDENEYAHPFGLYRNEILRGYRQFGFINYWIYSSAKSRPVTNDELKAASEFMFRFKNSPEHKENLVKNSGNNLILILLESFQSWPIGLKVDGEEITPFLNRLIKETDGIIYNPNVLPQIKGGRSADAQLILNTGLLPIELGATASLYATNEYPSLPKALKPLGYTSINMLTDNAHYWNQAATSKSYGFDRVIDRMRGDKPQVRSDEELFKRALDSLKRTHKPFYAQLVSMSGHDAIKMDRSSKLYGRKVLDESVANNLVITQYVDSCLGSFISGLKRNGLYENSIIIITGDHQAITFNKFQNRKEAKLSDKYVPLIILNSPIKCEKNVIIGQSDIFPSILDIMGISDYRFNGFGHSIFRKHPGGAMFQDYNTIGVTVQSKKDSLRNLWQISDILIRSNYFNKH